MKRALLIAGGTVSGLGAVLAITPPQLSSSENTLAAGIDAAPVAASNVTTQSTEPTPAATQSAATTKQSTSTSSKSVTATKSATPTAEASKGAAATESPTPAATKSATATPTPSTTKTTSKAVTGSFTGDISSVGPYGGVQIRITVSNGKITDVQAVQAPGGRDQRYTDMAVPVMRQRTLAAQSANITGVSGASYTSYNFWKSLTSAIAKSGL